MTLITNNPVKLAAAAHFDVWRYSLPPKLGVDQFRAVLPLLIERDSRDCVVITKEIDRANFEPLPWSRARAVFHTPYFSFDRLDAPSDAHPSLIDAVTANLGPDPVRVDQDLPVSLYQQLASMGGAEPAPGYFHPPINLYLIDRRTVSEQAGWGRESAIESATTLLIPGAESNRLREWMNRPIGDVLDSLDRLMSDHGVGSALASSPINVQELTGIPSMALPAGTWALYSRGSNTIRVFSQREIPWLGLPEPVAADTDTVQGLLDGAVGYEELDLSYLAYRAFGLSEATTVPASQLFRKWRERRAWADACYYLMATHITRLGIERAISLTQSRMSTETPASEADAYQAYRAGLGEAVVGMPLRVRTYFTHVHAGDRTHIPASATDHRVGAHTSLKIDAGVEAYDERGYFRAVSDITRSAVGTADAQTFYALLTKTLTEAVIPGCRPGVTGEEAFLSGLAPLQAERAWLESAGFCPPSGAPLSQIFGRDIGHLLGKQEPATVVIQPGYQEVFEAGMMAAAEIQWPYRDYCVGVEDVFMVGEDDPINLTRLTA